MTKVEKYILNLLLNGKLHGEKIKIMVSEDYYTPGGTLNSQLTDITDELKEVVSNSFELNN